MALPERRRDERRDEGEMREICGRDECCERVVGIRMDVISCPASGRFLPGAIRVGKQGASGQELQLGLRRHHTRSDHGLEDRGWHGSAGGRTLGVDAARFQEGVGRWARRPLRACADGVRPHGSHGAAESL